MSTPDSLLAGKLLNAAEATRLFVRELEAEGQHRWAEHFKRVASLLESGEAKAAVQLYQSEQRAGMGSLSDIYPGNGHFEKRWSQCSSAMGNVRLFLEYGLDRPAVNLEP